MRRGFTLIEIMIALMLASALLLSADLVFVQVADSRTALARSARVTDRDRNGSALMGRWVRQVDISPAPGTSAPRAFAGTESTATFATWCLGAGVWERSCDVTLRIVADSDRASVLGVASTGDSARVVLHGSDAALRYLLDAREGGHWMHVWGTGPTAPLAIGVVTATDTVVWRIGPRG